MLELNFYNFLARISEECLIFRAVRQETSICRFLELSHTGGLFRNRLVTPYNDSSAHAKKSEATHVVIISS